MTLRWSAAMRVAIAVPVAASARSDGNLTDMPVIDAATVVLLRPGPPGGGPECLMLRKNAGQAFGGLWVFPGGKHEPEEATGEAGARLAAVREALEETGLVLDGAELVP